MAAKPKKTKRPGGAAEVRAKGWVQIAIAVAPDFRDEIKEAWHLSRLDSMAEFIRQAIREKIAAVKAKN